MVATISLCGALPPPFQDLPMTSEQLATSAQAVLRILQGLPRRPYRWWLITDQASRLLLKHVKEGVTKLPLPMRNLEANTRWVLDRFPHRRIDLSELAKYELVARSVEYAASAAGNEFKYRASLTKAIIDGEPKVLVD